jgi:hypothetical protein
LDIIIVFFKKNKRSRRPKEKTKQMVGQRQGKARREDSKESFGTQGKVSRVSRESMRSQGLGPERFQG